MCKLGEEAVNRCMRQNGACRTSASGPVASMTKPITGMDRELGS